jgi:hypothetical protein
LCVNILIPTVSKLYPNSRLGDKKSPPVLPCTSHSTRGYRAGAHCGLFDEKKLKVEIFVSLEMIITI